MNKKEIMRRNINTKIEVREEGEGKRTITGFIPYNSRSQYLGWFYEYIEPTAFNKTLSDGADVKALVDHDSSKILGRVKNGSLRLENREDGLYAECDLPNTSYANDVYELIRDGYCNTMSFGFRIIDQDYTTDDAGIEVHKLREVALQEISWGVAFPAYEETDSQARSLENLLSKKDLSDDDKSELRSIIDTINSKLNVEEEPVVTETNTVAVSDTTAIDEERQFIESIRAELKSIFNKEV